jgi:hypothetical protein
VASQYSFVKRYENFSGVDYKSSDLKFPEQYATELRNIKFTQTGSIEKRRGYQAAASSAGGCGLFTYRKYDSVGAEVFEVLAVDTGLWKMAETTMTVTYAGAATNCEISLILDPATNQYRCQILEGSTQVLDYALGVGVDEAVPLTIANLITQINALPGFTAAATGSTAAPAAFLDTTLSYELIGTPWAGLARYWVAVNSPGTLFPGNSTYRNDAAFENTSGVQLQNCLYLGNGYDEVIKYDGQNAYRAGVPTPGAVTAIATADAAGFTGNNYVYKVQYLQKDAQGNETSGNYAITDPALSFGVNNRVDLTLPNILAASGFNTNCAIVSGAQVAVNTITVDNGSGGAQTLKVGDTAYLYDAVSAQYVERVVTAATSGSITISGAAVTVADNAVISNNLRITIWRSKTSIAYPTVWYAVAEIPNNSFTATQTYADRAQDAALGAIFLEPVTDRSPPVKGRYVSSFQNLLITGGNLESRNTVAFSDVESPEYFPTPDNQFIVNDQLGDRITGLSPSNEFFVVFQERGVHVISGQLSELAFRVDQVANDIGCASHGSIKDIRGALFFMSLNGPRILQGAQVPRGLGPFEQNAFVSRIDTVFDQTGELDTEKLWQLKRSIGFHDRIGQRYLCYVPCESVTAGSRYANGNSVIFVYDYPRDAWLEWDNLNAAGGITELGDDILFSERRYSITLSAVRSHLYRFHTTKTYLDYADHVSTIACRWKSAWDFLGEASILKSFLAIRVFSTEEAQNQFELDIKTETNWVKSTISSVQISVGSGGYGEEEWDLEPWGSPVDPVMTRKLNNNRVKSIRIVFEHDEMQKNFIVTGYELEVAAPYKPRFVS